MRDKELKLEDEASHILGEWGTGVPKEREVNRRRDICGLFLLDSVDV